MNKLHQLTINKLEQYGITTYNLAPLTCSLQKKYDSTLSLEKCIECIEHVLNKREVLHAILTGIAIDECVQKHLFDSEINNIIFNNESLYGIDEILVLSIVNIYGSIAFTNFGYLDTTKPGIIGEIDKSGKQKDKCHAFLDDIVVAIIASTTNKLAHEKRHNILHL